MGVLRASPAAVSNIHIPLCCFEGSAEGEEPRRWRPVMGLGRRECGVSRQALTCGEAGLLVTLGELNVKVGDQRVDVVVPLDLQAEGGGEGQVLALHRVDVHLLHGVDRRYK